MARITLDFDECGGDLLPPVCCRCGDASTGLSQQTYTWTPRWIILFFVLCFPIYVILMVTMTKRRVVSLPTCERHYYLGLWRKLLSGGGVSLIVGAVAWMVLTSGSNRSYSASSWDQIDRATQFTSIIIGVIILLFSMVIFVRPSQITRNTITLKGLSPKFVEATEQYRVLLEEFGE